jgi:hypothetical protein
MIPASKKPEDKMQKIAIFIPIWVQIIICLGGVLTAMVSSPLLIEKFFPTVTPTSSTVLPPPAPIPTLALEDTLPASSISSPTDVPSLCCLAGWDIFSTDGTSFQPSPQGNCSNIGIDELGIHASSCGLIFGRDDIKRRGIYGLSMPIEHNTTIRMSVTIINLIEGEMWVGLSNETNPQAGSLIFAMTPDPGGVSVFLNDISSPYARYRWSDMVPDIGWVDGQPWQYNFTIMLDGNKVLADVNSVKFAPMVASSTDRLFIGYRSKPDMIGTYLNATISNLSITDNP